MVFFKFSKNLFLLTFFCLGYLFILCKDYSEAEMTTSAVALFSFIKMFGHHILTVGGGLDGRNPQEAVHNYLIVLVVVHSDPNNICIWNGKDSGKECGTVYFPLGALSVSQRIAPNRYSYS